MESVSGVSNSAVPLTHIMRASYTGNRIAIPVESSQAIYARFKHITGVPAFSESRTVSVRKLRQLDLLIDQLSRLKNKEITVEFEKSSNESIDNLFNKYSGELRSRLISDIPDFNTGIYSPGVLLNLSA